MSDFEFCVPFSTWASQQWRARLPKLVRMHKSPFLRNQDTQFLVECAQFFAKLAEAVISGLICFDLGLGSHSKEKRRRIRHDDQSLLV
jgi:hypothetical protein